MPLRSKRPVHQASHARMRKVAEMRIKKQMAGKGILGELAKIIGPLVLKEGVKIGSALVQKRISRKPKNTIAGKKKKKGKKGKGLRPAGARAPARRRVAPMPRPAPRPKTTAGRGRYKKKKGGRSKY